MWSLYYSINKQVKYIARQVVVKAMKNMLGRRIEMTAAWQDQTESLFEKVTCRQKLKKTESKGGDRLNTSINFGAERSISPTLERGLPP